MAGMKDAFSRGITSINVRTSTFVEESRIKAYISSLEAEEKELKARLGSVVYESWKTKSSLNSSLMNDLCNEIDAKDNEIEVQRIRVKSVRMEADKILGTNTVAGELFCTRCGSKNMSGNRFCTKCGKELNS